MPDDARIAEWWETHADEAQRVMAERAATAAARRAVTDVLFAIGIDIDDHDSVQETRSLLLLLRNRERERIEMHRTIRRGIVHATITALFGAVSGVMGYLWHITHAVK